MKLHNWQDAEDRNGRPKKACADCGVVVVAWPDVDLTKVHPRCGEGAGDGIANILKSLGIEPCGDCNEHRKTINKIHGHVAAMLG